MTVELAAEDIPCVADGEDSPESLVIQKAEMAAIQCAIDGLPIRALLRSQGHGQPDGSA